MTNQMKAFAGGVLMGVLLGSGASLLAQSGGIAGGVADALRQIEEQHFQAKLLEIQPEPLALSPYGARFHEVVSVVPNANAVDLLTVNGHVLCQATNRGEPLLGWLVQRRTQLVDVIFSAR